MRDKFTAEEYKRISYLVECALAANNKAEAKRYSNQLKYIGMDVKAPACNMYSELISATIAASGAIREKDRMVGNAHFYLYKLEMYGVER